ncbi:hypothetical protein AAXE64_27910 [Priestia megaterium]|uniref:hypothetical protein n=1 Tax=Priestia megaterium TaxID=1404 RepID=UPI003CFE55BE
MEMRNLREEYKNSILIMDSKGDEYRLKAGRDMHSFMVNDKEIETLEEAKVALNILTKSLISMAGGSYE